jgi:MFS family permease
MQHTLRRTFASLSVRNFRLYLTGQGISQCGSWMRMIALSWLVLQLTHSGTQLGLVTAAQFLPVLALGAYGGVLVDRMDNKRLLVYTQSVLGVISLVMGLLVMTHSIQLWMVYVAAIVSGLITVVDNPARQTFVVQMVGEEHLKNAVTLNSTVVNVARIVGPSIAAALIAAVGIGLCFIVDAGTFVAVLVALFRMRRDALFTVEPVPPKRGQIMAGFRYVRATPALRTTLLMMVIIGTFTYEFAVVLPLFATVTLHGNATTYSLMSAALGAGSIIGALYTAGRANATMRQLITIAGLFGAVVVLAALAPNLVILLFLLVAVGVLSIMFIALGNTTLQLTSEPNMRGRVMSLWSIAFQGTTPIGGPLIGALIDHSNPRIGLVVGGVAALFAAIVGSFAAGYRLRGTSALPVDITDAS